jgi:hypothetical protein
MKFKFILRLVTAPRPWQKTDALIPPPLPLIIFMQPYYNVEFITFVQ